MAKASSPSTQSPVDGLPTPDQYAEFIGQVDLEALWVKDARITNRHGSHTPTHATIHIDEGREWEPIESGFIATHRYDIRFDAPDDDVPAEVSVTFGVRFMSEQSMTDGIFEVFQDVNLPVNTWPYLREFVANALGRMGWESFTLPALKRRAKRRGAAPAKATTPPRRSRATSPSRASQDS